MKTRNLFLTLLPALVLVGCGTENPFDRGSDYDDGTELAVGDQILFSTTILPALSRCAGCHSSGTGGWTYAGGGNAYGEVLSVVDIGNPEGSLLLVKGSGNGGHGGGAVFASSSDSYADILSWINSGASNN